MLFFNLLISFSSRFFSALVNLPDFNLADKELNCTLLALTLEAWMDFLIKFSWCKIAFFSALVRCLDWSSFWILANFFLLLLIDFFNWATCLETETGVDCLITFAIFLAGWVVLLILDESLLISDFNSSSEVEVLFETGLELIVGWLVTVCLVFLPLSGVDLLLTGLLVAVWELLFAKPLSLFEEGVESLLVFGLVVFSLFWFRSYGCTFIYAIWGRCNSSWSCCNWVSMHINNIEIRYRLI